MGFSSRSGVFQWTALSLGVMMMTTAMCWHHNMGASASSALEEEAYMNLYVDPTNLLSAAIPADFASASFEWSEAHVLSKSKALRILFGYLRHSGSGQGMNMRVGGASAEFSWWNNAGAADHHYFKNQSTACSAFYNTNYCVTCNITTDMIHSLHDMVKAINGTLLLDLTMAQNHSAVWAVEEAQQILTTLADYNPNFGTLLEGFELGNEPDLFSMGVRAPSYSIHDYLQEWDLYHKALVQQVKFPRLQFLRGGTFAYQQAFRNATADLIGDYLPSLYAWSFHRYACLACGPTQVPTMAQLLSNQATDGIAQDLAQEAALAVKHGIAYHVGETNSADCGGRLGLSDTMAAALWSLDYMFALATRNVTRVNYHGGATAPYSWIWYNATTQGVAVKPLFYAMFVWTWIMAQANTRIMALNCRHGSGCQNPIPTIQHPTTGAINIKAWAVTNGQGHAKVILINKSLDPHENPQVIRIYAPYQQKHHDSNDKNNDEFPLWSTLQPYSQEDGLSATSLSFSGWTWHGSTNGHRKGTFTTSHVCQPRLDDTVGLDYCETKLPHATVMILSMNLDTTTKGQGKQQSTTFE
jgi:hypothetical protein